MTTYKIVQAGCGHMANTWITYALEREDTEIVAFVDLYEAAAAKMNETYGLSVPWFASVEEAIRQTGANMVFDATIPSAHLAVATAALEGGCHLMSEKPMAASMEAAEQLAQLAGTKPELHYSIMQNRRYLKDIRALRELVASGVIGKPGFVTADFFIGAHFGGFRDAMESPLILDMAIHTFDQARFIIGANPVSVYCHEFNPEGSWYEGNAAAVCIFEFDNGAVFTYNGSWCSEGLRTTWEAEWRVAGSQGTASWRDGAPYAEVVAPGQEANFLLDYDRIEAPYTWHGREGHHGCLDEMFLAIEEERSAETSYMDNIYSTAMVFGAIQSAKEQRKVMLLRVP
ncbi:Gfo/Idh/MocA family protein [Paenibacillus roseipurpureus]|uniref:Gfo/Idh/MocA family oxidoreductase n=1 Tax=Paenibacillus roseopurpureus TaxID=2918901 RepID=A0AA96LR90_9BACL|nr:Gfo/Idh/MocA family oxidoreductase [Paenibacillus sp. MBLB1832]WNR44383.1 Gfo/Idh/MocA family oxidoreductase [Paenibacillus sp. MBLB1832]